MALFDRARLKVGRANHHINDLNAKVDAFAKSNPYVIFFEADKHSPDLMLQLGTRIGAHVVFALNEMSLVTGDAVHNLRSALDLLAVEAVEFAKDNPKNVYFPFCEDGNDLQDMIERRNIDRAGEEVVAAIKTMKPYPGGNDVLRAIHDLDVADKHRALLVMGTRGQLPLEAFDPEIKDKHGYAGFQPKAGQHINLAVTVQIGKGLPFAERPVVETLKQFAELTADIIDTFAKLPSFNG